MKHMYIHIPFCKKICSYCDFCKMFYNHEFIDKYLDELNNEITNYYNGEEMETVYIGGGTPSSLSYDELNKLFKILSVVKVSNNYEYSFECNPDDITEELIDILIKNRVNRISIGIESFDKDNLGFMERSVDFKDIQNKINMIRSKGIDNINLDLIYGIPGENIKTLKKDLKLMVKLKPKHISTYSLQIEEHTKIYNEGINPIDEDLDSKMYFTIIKYLKKKGYIHYEISNFSLKGYESSHNLSYWNNEEYYGFGLGASGYVDGFRYDNTRNLNKYLSGDYHNYESLLGNDDKMYDEVMLGLRKTKGINLKDFENKYGIKFENKYDINELIKSKELIIKKGYLYVNPKYLYIINDILIKIL